MRLWATGFLLLSVTAALAANSGDALTVYSNLCLHSESGDVLGTRISLLHLAEGDYALYQDSEGWPEAPKAFALDKDLLKKSRIEFNVAGQYPITVVGRIAGNELVLTSGGIREHDENVLRLKRVTLPERIPACR